MTPKIMNVPQGNRIQPSNHRLGLAVLATCISMLLLSLPAARAGIVPHDIAAGNLTVTQIPGYDPNNPAGGDDNTNCIVTLSLSVNDFRRGTYNRGDYNIQIGSSASDDSPNGILISSVAQNVRTNYGTNSYCTSAIETNAGGAYRITSYGHGPTSSSIEMAVNVAGAWFPYSSWLGGHARTSPYLNGGTNSNFTGSPGMKTWRDGAAYTNFTDLKETQNLGGRSIVDLRSFGFDSRTDGVLLVNHGKDEANYALSKVNDDGTWTTYVHDNAANSSSYEQDPIAFVFVPRTNTMVVSGRVQTDGTGAATIPIYSGSSPQFTVTYISGGRMTLKMNNPDYSPTNGILIVSLAGGGNLNLDNIVTYEPNAAGDGWEIQSRDGPDMNLQTPKAADNTAEDAFSFVYIPANTPGVTVTPTNNLLTTEAGGTASFTVVLDRQPYADVTIGVSSSDETEGTVSTSTLTFTSSNWSTPQTVTVTGVDDATADGSIPYTILLAAATSADSRYNGMVPHSVSVVNADNEPGVTLSKSSVTTTEAGGTDTFTVMLNTAPSADVTIGFSSSKTTEGTVSPSSLTFTADNWSTPQTVMVTGVDDFVVDGNVAYSIITAPAVSADTGYNDLNAPDVSAINVDNDTAGYTFSTTSVVVSESGTSTNITLALNSQPTTNVIISFASTDTTEGTVAPASLTFAPANWNTPQTFTVTGVDDPVMDGSIEYSIVTTVSSSDPVYAALNPVDIAATTIDNEGALTLPSGDAFYGVGDPGVGLDGRAVLVDPFHADYNNGTLTVTITAGGGADDRLEVRNTGTGAGQIGVSGSTVSYGGTAIGAISGGSGATLLAVALNAAASPAAAQQLIRSVTYRTVNTNLAKSTRTASVVLVTGQGGTSSASKTVQVGVVRVYAYQQGVDHGYGTCSDAVDVEIHPNAPDTTFPGGCTGTATPAQSPTAQMWLDYVTSANPEVLLGFTNVFGNGLGQIPLGAKIVSAQVVLNISDSGNGMMFHRMLIPWDPNTATWTTFDNGVDWNDAEAVSTNATVLGDTGAASNTGATLAAIGATEDVRIWAAGQANYGWVLRPWDFGSNGTGFSSCDHTNADLRPLLRVYWVPASIPSASFAQGVNGYTNALDTSIRANAPDADRSLVTPLYVDWAVTGSTPENDEQVLLQFGNIIGNDLGQIPPGALVHTAVLDLNSSVGNGFGQGGTFHAVLQSWSDTNTWNYFVGGLAADGVKAAAAVSASAGSPTLFPLAQETRLTFDLTADVQAWVNGTMANNGWVILPWTLGSDGWGINSAEAADTSVRPQLSVYYSLGANVTIGKLSLVSWSSSSVQIGLAATANQTYSVLRAAALGGAWTTIGTVTVGAGGTATYTDNAPLAGKAFYRVSYP